MPRGVRGLTRRKGSSIWRYEIRIPADLAHFHKAKRSHRISLGTPDLREAEVNATKLNAHWKAMFAEQRRQLAASEPVEQVTPEMARQFAQQMLHDTLTTTQIRASFTDRRLVMRVLGAQGLAGMQLAADRIGIAVEIDTPGANEGAEVYFHTLKDAMLKPGHVERPAAPKFTKPRKLREVFTKWKASEGPSLKKGSVRAKELALAVVVNPAAATSLLYRSARTPQLTSPPAANFPAAHPPAAPPYMRGAISRSWSLLVAEAARHFPVQPFLDTHAS